MRLYSLLNDIKLTITWEWPFENNTAGIEDNRDSKTPELSSDDADTILGLLKAGKTTETVNGFSVGTFNNSATIKTIELSLSISITQVQNVYKTE